MTEHLLKERLKIIINSNKDLSFRRTAAKLTIISFFRVANEKSLPDMKKFIVDFIFSEYPQFKEDLQKLLVLL